VIQKLVPFTIVGDNADQPWIKAGETLYAPEEISAMILRKMKDIAERYIGQGPSWPSLLFQVRFHIEKQLNHNTLIPIQ
jgi:molecular chaperone DnaK (HSP70)